MQTPGGLGEAAGPSHGAFFLELASMRVLSTWLILEFPVSAEGQEPWVQEERKLTGGAQWGWPSVPELPEGGHFLLAGLRPYCGEAHNLQQNDPCEAFILQQRRCEPLHGTPCLVPVSDVCGLPVRVSQFLSFHTGPS